MCSLTHLYAALLNLNRLLKKSLHHYVCRFCYILLHSAHFMSETARRPALTAMPRTMRVLLGGRIPSPHLEVGVELVVGCNGTP